MNRGTARLRNGYRLAPGLQEIGDVDPLPFEHLRGRADVILAVDTTVGPIAPRGIPDPWENLFATLQVMSHTIVQEKLKRGAPDILIRPELSTFRLLDPIRGTLDPMRGTLDSIPGPLGPIQ